MMRASRFVAVALGSALAASTLLLSPGVSSAGPRAHAQRAEKAEQRFQEYLGLNNEQMTVVREIRARHADQRRETGMALHKAHAELRDLALRSGDQAAVKAKSAEVASLTSRALDLRVAELQELAPHLTPEQRDKLAKMSPLGGHHHRGGKSPSGQS